MYFTCDDIAAKHEGHLRKLERLRETYPNFKVTCFVIAGGLDARLIDWLGQDWIEVAVHGYDHDWPPECERDDRAERIGKALSILKPLLPEKYGFRAPGFQMTGTTYPVLRELGFWYVAHQFRVQPLKHVDKFLQDRLINSHIYEEIGVDGNGKFKFISEGFGQEAGFDHHAGQIPA